MITVITVLVFAVVVGLAFLPAILGERGYRDPGIEAIPRDIAKHMSKESLRDYYDSLHDCRCCRRCRSCRTNPPLTVLPKPGRGTTMVKGGGGDGSRK